MFEKGTVCIKLCGRDAGSRCVVVGKSGKFVEVACPERKKIRRCNPAHLKITGEKINAEEFLQSMKKEKGKGVSNS
ncbi:MAG: 50S ribosomal protein L14e [Candidatus Micrarchaeia archaeon]